MTKAMPADASKPRDEGEVRREIERLRVDAKMLETYPASRLAPRADLDALADLSRARAADLEASLKEPQP